MVRYHHLDLAKGFTVLFMPTVHCVMMYGDSSVNQSPLGAALGLIAEWPGAQVFMYVMGIAFSMTKKSVAGCLKRALLIFISGYLLNALKFLVPFPFLPEPFLQSLSFAHHQQGLAWKLLLIGDILQFAGIAMALLTFIKASKYPVLVAIVAGYSVIVFSPLFWDLHHSNPVLDHLLHLAGGDVDDVFFPFFPWAVYPLVGFAIGNYLQYAAASHKVIAVTGLYLFISGWILHEAWPGFPMTSFWRTYPDMTIAHLGFVMVWTSLWFWIDVQHQKQKTNQRFQLTWLNIGLLFLQFCGRHITAIYVLQWVVIFWMLPVVGYQRLGTAASIGTAVFITVVVFGIVLKTSPPNLLSKGRGGV